MTNDLSIKIDVLAGSDIPCSVIPQMVDLANKLKICVEGDLNSVKTFVYPGDDPFDLAVAWMAACFKNKR